MEMCRFMWRSVETGWGFVDTCGDMRDRVEIVLRWCGDIWGQGGHVWRQGGDGLEICRIVCRCCGDVRRCEKMEWRCEDVVEIGGGLWRHVGMCRIVQRWVEMCGDGLVTCRIV